MVLHRVYGYAHLLLPSPLINADSIVEPGPIVIITP